MDASPDLLFGTIAVQAGYLSREQVEKLLQEQGASAESAALGELCLERGLLTAEQVDSVLAAQQLVELPEGRKLLGAIAVRNGLATPEEIEVALEAQKQADTAEPPSAARLGEILEEMGTLTPQQVAALLAVQARLRKSNGQARAEGSDAVGMIVQEGGEPLEVNGEKVTEPRALKPGDRLKIGGAVFRFEGGAQSAPVLVPKLAEKLPVAEFKAEELEEETKAAAEASPDQSSTRIKAPVPPETAAAETTEIPKEPAAKFSLKAKLQAFDAAVAKVIPGIHTQRKYILLAAVLGLVAAFLPWRHRVVEGTEWGMKSFAGVTAFLLFFGSAVTAFLKKWARPLPLYYRLGVLGASALAVLVAFFYILNAASSPHATAHVGAYLAILAGLAAHVGAWTARPAPPEEDKVEIPGAPAPPPEGAWGRLKDKLGRLFRDMTGKRAKEKAAALEKRDQLLGEIAEAALAAKTGGPEAEAVTKARESLEAAKKKGESLGQSGATKDVVKAKADLKAAEGRLKRALLKLGRTVVDKDVDVPPAKEKIDEVKKLDAVVKDLS